MQVTSMSIHLSSLLQSHTNQDAEVIFTYFHKNHKQGTSCDFVVFPEDVWGYEMLSQCICRVLPCPSPFCKVTPLLLKVWANQHSSSVNLPPRRFTLKPSTHKFQVYLHTPPEFWESEEAAECSRWSKKPGGECESFLGKCLKRFQKQETCIFKALVIFLCVCVWFLFLF